MTADPVVVPSLTRDDIIDRANFEACNGSALSRGYIDAYCDGVRLQPDAPAWRCDDGGYRSYYRSRLDACFVGESLLGQYGRSYAAMWFSFTLVLLCIAIELQQIALSDAASGMEPSLASLLLSPRGRTLLVPTSLLPFYLSSLLAARDAHGVFQHLLFSD